MLTYIQAQMSDCDLLLRATPASRADAAGGGEMTQANWESAVPGSDPELGCEGQGAGGHLAGQRHRHERLIGNGDMQGDAEA